MSKSSGMKNEMNAQEFQVFKIPFIKISDKLVEVPALVPVSFQKVLYLTISFLKGTLKDTNHYYEVIIY